MTADLLSYRSDPALKARLLTNMAAHREADRLMKGLYAGSDPDGGTDGDIEFKGCAVGCTIADFLADERGVTLQELAAQFDESDDGIGWHETWARVTGLPEWLARVDDYLFESLRTELSQEWPLRLLSAVPVGVDLTAAREAWLRDLVFDPVHGAMASAAAALEAAGLAPEAARLRGLPSTTDWSAAWDAAGAAARAAWDAAGAAARAAWDAAGAAARAAAGAAAGAAWAAGDAARAAGAAGAAAWAASNEWIADRLIHHLSELSPQAAR